MLVTYCVLYGVIRLIVERVRTDSLYIGAWPAAYWLSGVRIITGLLVIASGRLWPALAAGEGMEPSR